jgi:6-pyruvoyltetrahydropterin/6-carboxytetrahydropterin synthase
MRIEVTCSTMGVDHLGVILDFSEIKRLIGGWLDKNWDHGAVLNVADKELIELLRKQQNKVYVLDCNPTAENLAVHLLREARKLLIDIEHVDVVRVRIWETPNCWAEAR